MSSGSGVGSVKGSGLGAGQSQWWKPLPKALYGVLGLVPARCQPQWIGWSSTWVKGTKANYLWPAQFQYWIQHGPYSPIAPGLNRTGLLLLTFFSISILCLQVTPNALIYTGLNYAISCFPHLMPYSCCLTFYARSFVKFWSGFLIFQLILCNSFVFPTLRWFYLFLTTMVALFSVLLKALWFIDVV